MLALSAAGREQRPVGPTVILPSAISVFTLCACWLVRWFSRSQCFCSPAHARTHLWPESQFDCCSFWSQSCFVLQKFALELVSRLGQSERTLIRNLFAAAASFSCVNPCLSSVSAAYAPDDAANIHGSTFPASSSLSLVSPPKPALACRLLMTQKVNRRPNERTALNEIWEASQLGSIIAQ